MSEAGLIKRLRDLGIRSGDLAADRIEALQAMVLTQAEEAAKAARYYADSMEANRKERAAQSARIAQLEAELAAAREKALAEAAKGAGKTSEDTCVVGGHVSAGEYAAATFHAIRALKDHPHDV